MTTPLRRRLRRIRRYVAYGVAALVIMAGLCVAVLSQLLPALSGRPEQVAAWLEQRIGRPVRIAAAEAQWTRRGPRFDLDGLRIGAPGDDLDIGRAALQIDIYSGLLPGSPLTSLQLTGLALDVERDAAGEWRLHGVARNAPSAEQATPDLGLLESLGELVLEDASLHVHDAASQRSWQIDSADLRLRSAQGRWRVGAVLQRGDGAPLQVALDLDEALAGGTAWLGSDGLSLSTWLAGALEQPVVDADADFDVWLTIAQRRVAQARYQARVALRDAGDAAPPPLRLDGDWQRDADGWRLDSALGFGDAADGTLRIARDATRTVVEGAALDLAAAAAWAARAPRVPDGVRAWLQEAKPAGRLQGSRIEWRGERIARLQGAVAGAGIAAVGNRPGLSGLDLQFDGDGDAIAVTLRGDRFAFDWMPAFGVAHTPRVDGELLVYRDERAHWVADVRDLHLVAPDYDVRIGGALTFDGGRPSADLRAVVGAAPIIAAKKFWIRHKMPPATVRWLDTAIVDGRLEGGRAMVRGDLDDWPFKQQEGRFEAEAIIAGTTLQFRPDWPAAEHLAGTARFINNGMLIDVGGRLLGIDAPHAVGRIERFKEPWLELAIDAHAPGAELLRLIRESPLHQPIGTKLEGVSIGGTGDVHVDLRIPLKKELGTVDVDGEVQLADADLRDARWGVALDAAHGKVRFDERGAQAERLAVLYSGQAAQFSLAMGSFVQDPQRVLEAALEGRIEPHTLLDFQPSLAWLRPFLNGASDWQIRVLMPRDPAPDAPVADLVLFSDLLGTDLSLPAPLRKAQGVRMPLALSIGLPVERGSLDLTLGSLLHLYGRIDAEGGLDGVAAFGAAARAEPPADGLTVVGEVPVLDATGWSGLAVAGSGGGAIGAIDLFAGELSLAQRAFPETRVTLRHTPQGDTVLGFSGAPLQGEIEIPHDAELMARGITAQFERFHWPSAADGAAGPDLADPRSIPPLHLAADDLRVANAALGAARLETHPTPDGMRIERFESRSPALELFLRGDWTRAGLTQRTDVAAELTSPDLGAMLRALGFSELVEGGQTLAKLQLSWPGTPAAFALERVDGTLDVSVGRGRIPDVSPGAGRIFGLFSLSQIPRRLALDFSDFFRSGLAFNRITGSFVLGDGYARTDDLLIDSPAAEIRIKGRTGIAAMEYEQTMEVLPRAGSVLPVVGALAAGPAGAAIGAVAQAVLQTPFKQITRTLYKVEGNWKQPTIDVLERGPARGAG